MSERFAEAHELSLSKPVKSFDGDVIMCNRLAPASTASLVSV